MNAAAQAGRRPPVLGAGLPTPPEQRPEVFWRGGMRLEALAVDHVQDNPPT
jgi:hypothetical protein